MDQSGKIAAQYSARLVTWTRVLVLVTFLYTIATIFMAVAPLFKKP